MPISLAIERATNPGSIGILVGYSFRIPTQQLGC